MKTWLCHVVLLGAQSTYALRYQKTLDVDVAIIGGGSGGVHAAIQLKDAGASVVVLEKKSQIGGHAETYINPKTKKPANVGVSIFENQDTVKKYFSRLNVPTAVIDPTIPAALYDFSLGFPIPALDEATKAAQAQAFAQALQIYTTTVLPKYPWLDQGYFVPQPVPEELTLPFGQFAVQNNITALVPYITEYNWFTGNVSTLPALYGIKGFGPGLISSIGKFIVSATGNTRSLYDAAAADLGNSVLLNVSVQHAQRNCEWTCAKGTKKSGVCVSVVQGGQTVLVRSRKLLVAIPPTLDNLRNYDLTETEQSLFSKLSAFGYFAGVANVPGFNASFQNIGVATPFNQPVIPGDNGFYATGSPGDFLLGVAFENAGFTQSEAIDTIKGELARLAKAGAVPADAATTVTFPYTSNHAPYNCRVSAAEIKSGYYNSLLGLQGQNNTYWTGATWTGHNSGLIWKWNEGTVVPGLKKDLGL